jgi:hypothetical protein
MVKFKKLFEVFQTSYAQKLTTRESILSLATYTRPFENDYTLAAIGVGFQSSYKQFIKDLQVRFDAILIAKSTSKEDQIISISELFETCFRAHISSPNRNRKVANENARFAPLNIVQVAKINQ